MGLKGHIIVQKGLKMHEKRQEVEFLDLKNLFFSGIFLSEIGGYLPPPSPLKGQSLCFLAEFSLAERGGIPTPPLTEKIRKVVFEGLP